MNEIVIRCKIITYSDFGFEELTDEESRRVIEYYRSNASEIELANTFAAPYGEKEISIVYDDFYTICDLHNEINKNFGIPGEISKDDFCDLCRYDALLIKADDNVLFSVNNYNLKLKMIVDRFNLSKINAYLLFVFGYGDFMREEGLRFFMYSHEGNKHNRPHVHVETNDFREGSVDILTLGQNKGGKLNDREMRKIKKLLAGKQEDLLRFWNDHTDGINVDIDYYLGLISIDSRQ